MKPYIVTGILLLVVGVTWVLVLVPMREYEEETSGTKVGSQSSGAKRLGENPAILSEAKETPNAVKISRIETAATKTLLTGLRFNQDRLLGIAIGGNLEDDPGELLRTQDGGKSWARVSSTTSKRLYDACFVTNETIIVVGLGGRIIRSVDSGRTWLQVREGHEWLSGVTFVSPKIGFAIGSIEGVAVMLRSNDGGKTWKSLTVPRNCAKSSLRVIQFRDQMHGVIAGTNGVVLVTNDGGRNWLGQIVGDGYLRGIAYQGENEIWICGSPGVLLKSNDLGRTFVTQEFPQQDKLNSLAFSTMAWGWITSMSGHLYQTQDSGKTWQSIHHEKSQPLTGILAPSLKDPGFVVGGGGIILRMDFH